MAKHPMVGRQGKESSRGSDMAPKGGTQTIAGTPEDIKVAPKSEDPVVTAGTQMIQGTPDAAPSLSKRDSSAPSPKGGRTTPDVKGNPDQPKVA